MSIPKERRSSWPQISRVTVAASLATIGVLALVLVAFGLVRANPDNLDWQYSYDDNNRLIKITDPAGRDTRMHYELDSAKRPRKIIRSQDEGPTVTREFDEAGRLTQMTDGAGTVSYGYDERSRVTRVQRAGTPAVSYEYDWMNRVTRLQVGDFYRVEYVYDFLGRLESMKTPVGEIRYEYLTGQGQIVRTLPNQFKTIWEYGPNGRLQMITHADTQNVILAQFAYSYRVDGQIESIRERSGATENVKSYNYDSVGQLVMASGPSGLQFYEYDLAGNRLKSESSGKSTQIYSYDWAGRVATVNGMPVEHDAAGNLTAVTTGGSNLKYRHNQGGQLADALDGKVIYRYDGDGSMIERRSVEGSASFIRDVLAPIWGPLVISKEDGRRTLVIWEGTTPLLLISNGEAEVMLHDRLGSVRLTTDIHGRVTRRRDFEPYGDDMNHVISAGLVPRLAGLFWDEEAKVYLTGSRAYSPVIGRWLQPDPGKAIPSGYPNESSLYAYCSNNPTTLIDLDGEAPDNPESSWLDDHIEWLSRWRNMSQGERWNDFADTLWKGRFFGTRFGDEGSLYWADRWAKTDDWRYAVPAGFASLWTSKSAGDTLTVLTLGPLAKSVMQTSVSFNMLRSSASAEEVIKRVGRIIFDPRKHATIRREASKFMREEMAAIRKIGDFDHLFLPNSPSWWAKQSSWVRGLEGLKGGGWNYLEMPAKLNRWMGTSSTQIATWLPREVTHNLIRAGVGFSAAMAWQRGTHLGSHVREGLSMVGSLSEAAGTGSKYPSTVGGVSLGGAGNLIEGLELVDAVTVDRNNNLVLVGKTDKAIKLPPLRIDDVVTVFRSVYIFGEGPSVTIDPKPEKPQGPEMIIRHGKATDNTYVGWVLYQADRLMKGYTLGEDNIAQQEVVSTVPGYEKILETIFFGGEDPEKLRKRAQWERFWIVPAETQRFNAPKNELTLFDVPLKVNTQTMKWRNGKLEDDASAKSSPGALAFTEWFRTNYDLIASERFLTPPAESGITTPVPVFTELRRVALITAIAEKLRDQGVPLPFWMRDYEVRPVPFEKVTPSLTVTRERGRSLARIYGGVNLSTADENLRNFTPMGDVSRLPQQDAASVRAKLNLAGALESAVRAMPAAVEPLKVQTFTHQATSYQTVSLPGADTRALAPNRLDVVDLEVPVDGGAPIQLPRSYHSFFNPGGAWGKGWAMDLPRLDPIRLPLKRTDKGVEYQTAYELITPLNSRYARFSHVDSVAMLGGNRFLVPDQPGEFFGVAPGMPDFLTGPTVKLLRKDGGAWHFSKTGELLATEQNGSRVVYERDGGGRLTRVVGLLGRRPLAFIELRYDGSGRIASATAKGDKREVAVRYEYDEVGRLAAVVSDAGRVGYHYDGTLLTAIGHRPVRADTKQTDETIVRRFEYGPRGRLLAEFGPDGTKTEYRVAADADGSSVTVGGSGNASSDFMRYDHASRPVEARYADGSRAAWSYPEGGGAAMALTQPNGQVISMTETADQRSRTVQLAPDRKLVAEYDGAGRLKSVSDNGRLSLQQVWSPDGRLTKAANETSAANFQYDRDGLVSQVWLAPPGESGTFKVWQATRLDPAGRPLEITDYRGLQSQMSYDSAGELLQVVTRRDGQNYGFRIDRDDSGRVREVKSSWGAQKYFYDPSGSLAKVEEERNGQRSVAEWEAGSLRKLRQFDGGEFAFSDYVEGAHAGLPMSVTAPNGLKLNYSYDESNRLSQVAVGSAYRLSLSYDTKGRLTRWGYARLPQ
ncbi:MAG: hypothetical protein IPJ27_23280 [Candidatus Accumulibacter sp.]|uniref:Teneurin-like YD-shell domain-containing protein n=1 Tax=Candidatus Accumulibacter proximus TaxID=2954385 RepID=A0A935Q1W5_9PROT|nr:hypothetical protein [Candidatus Accumulibacter proximus]